MKILKSTATKKVIVCFYNLCKKLLKVAAFVIFTTSIMVLFEIHQRFKGHVLNELRVSLFEAYFFGPKQFNSQETENTKLPLLRIVKCSM